MAGFAEVAAGAIAMEGQLTGVAPLRSALQTAIVGTLPAAAAFAIARLAAR